MVNNKLSRFTGSILVPEIFSAFGKSLVTMGSNSSSIGTLIVKAAGLGPVSLDDVSSRGLFLGRPPSRSAIPSLVATLFTLEAT